MKQEKQQEMIELIERWRQSGKSVKGFCKQEGVSPSTLYYWLKKLNGNPKDNPMPTKGFVPFSLNESISQVIDPPMLRVNLPSGVSIDIFQEVDVDYLKRLCQ
ncbi:MAG: hypothetical protein LAT68_06520 [Cyclobacteriaceae bacterium]|nr:hypothetical protein [Cyclobacteriaceae bacterium]